MAPSGDMPGAETLLRKAIDTDTDRLQAYNMLGQIYARQGRLDDAKAQYLDVLKRDPEVDLRRHDGRDGARATG